MKRLVSISFVFLLLAACGGNGSPTTGTYQVTGAQTASGSCTASAAYTDTILGFNLDGGESLTFSAQLPGTALTTGTYTPANVTFDNADYSDGTTGDDWVSTNGGQGTFNLILTSTGASTDVASGMLWSDPHGTFQATLPANSGTPASGTVTVNASF